MTVIQPVFERVTVFDTTNSTHKIYVDTVFTLLNGTFSTITTDLEFFKINN